LINENAGKFLDSSCGIGGYINLIVQLHSVCIALLF
jgi:hypothetical protein